jgi:hypothetical protein
MSRYAKQGITEEALQSKIDDVGGPHEAFTNVQSVINDIKKIEVDCENVLGDDYDLEELDYSEDGFSYGYDTLSSGVVVRWFKIGGDWEIPVGVCLYVGDDSRLRAYIPKDGNVYNKRLKSAYGNNDDGEDHMEDEFDMDAMRNAASKRIVFKN